MKLSFNTSGFKQIARNHQAYKEDITKGTFDTHVDKYLRLGSKDAHHTIVGSGIAYQYNNYQRMMACINAALLDSTVRPLEAIIAFSLQGGGAHAVGIALSNDVVNLYDPNFGVFQAKTDPIDQLPNLIQDFFNTYRISNGFALPVL